MSELPNVCPKCGAATTFPDANPRNDITYMCWSRLDVVQGFKQSDRCKLTVASATIAEREILITSLAAVLSAVSADLIDICGCDMSPYAAERCSNAAIRCSNAATSAIAIINGAKPNE